MLEKFSLAALSTMDGGRLNETFEQALRRLQEDCKDRPAVKGARKLTLTVSLAPLADDAGELESIDARIDFNEKAPKRASKIYNMESFAGGLLFNELSPDEVKQRTLDMATKPRARTSADAAHEAKEVADAR